MNKSQSTYFYIKYVGQKVGHMMSKSEGKLWDIDIKEITVSQFQNIKCTSLETRLELSCFISHDSRHHRLGVNIAFWLSLATDLELTRIFRSCQSLLAWHLFGLFHNRAWAHGQKLATAAAN